jgi:hypothetical protein
VRFRIGSGKLQLIFEAAKLRRETPGVCQVIKRQTEIPLLHLEFGLFLFTPLQVKNKILIENMNLVIDNQPIVWSYSCNLMDKSGKFINLIKWVSGKYSD